MSTVLLMDYRQAPWMKPHLERRGFQVHVGTLYAGDFAWSCPLGRVGLEDKPLTALLSDRRNGRLDDELRRLCDTYAIPILMVRGTPRIKKDGGLWFPPKQAEVHKGWTFINLDNLLVGRQLRGVLVAWCPKDGDLGERLSTLYNYTQSPPANAATRPRLKWRKPLTGRALVVYNILEQVRALRDRRALAEKLAAVPLSSLLNLTTEDLQEAGFTKLMAERVRDVLQELEA